MVRAARPRRRAGVLEHHRSPTSLGDGPIAGDGEGVLTGYAVEINGVVTTYPPTLPRSGTSSGWSSDMPVQIAIWTIGYEGGPARAWAP